MIEQFREIFLKKKSAKLLHGGNAGKFSDATILKLLAEVPASELPRLEQQLAELASREVGEPHEDEVRNKPAPHEDEGLENTLMRICHR
jgi:hypothetical protein